MAQPKLNVQLTASDQTAAAFNSLQKRLEGIERTNRGLRDSIGGIGQAFVGVFAAIQVGQLVKATLGLSDAYKSVNARIKVVSDTTEQFVRAQSELFKISQDTRVSYVETAELYQRLARGTKDFGVSQEVMLRVTEGVNKALIVSGASGQAANAALIQLSQGLGAGALRGQEFTSVQEQAVRILQAVSDGLGVTQAELRKLAMDGKLTTDVFIEGFLKGMPKIQKEFEQMPVTISQAGTLMRNSLTQTIGKLDEMLGFSKSLAETMKDVATGIDAIGAAAQKNKGFFDTFTDSISAFFRKIFEQQGVGIGIGIIDENSGIKGAKSTPKLPPGKPKPEDEAAIKKRESFIQKFKDQYLSFIDGERALFVEQAKRLKLSEKELAQLMSMYDAMQGVKKAEEASNKAKKEAAALSREVEENTRKQAAAEQRSQRILAGFNDQIDAYREMINLRGDGIYRTQIEIQHQERLNKLQKMYADAKRQIAMSDDINAPQRLQDLEDQRQAMERQINLLKQIAEAQRTDVIAGGINGFKKYAEEVGDFARTAEDMVVNAFRGMEDALVSFVQTGKLDFKSLANSIIADLIRIQIQQTITQPLAQIFGSFNPFGGTKTLPVATSSVGQGLTLPPLGGARAIGGTVSPNKSYLVGEKGAELFVPGQTGTIVPNDQMGGAGTVINQTINVTTGVQQTVRAEIMTMMPQIAAATKAAVADAKMRGGSYAAALR